MDRNKRKVGFNMKKLILSLFFMLSFSIAANGGTIKGRVVSAKDASTLIGANVMLVGTTLGAATDSDGLFRIDNVPTGSYKIKASFMGFKDVTLNVALGKYETVTVNFKLKESVFNLDAVVVTATRTEKALKDVPMLTELISRRQLETTGTVTVQDALEDLPGVEFSPDAHGANIMINGLGPKYILFLVDGERVAGEVKGNIDFSRQNTANIERIEVVKGASSSLYGSNAIGGVVNIITQKVKSPLELNFNSRIGKYNELALNGSLGLKRKNFTSRTDFIKKSSDGYDLFPEHQNRQTVEEYKDLTLIQKFTYKPFERLKLSGSASYFERERFDLSRKYKFKHPKYYGVTYDAGAEYSFENQAMIKASWHSDVYDTKDVMERIQNEERRTYRHRASSGRLVSNFNLGEANLITVGTELLQEEVFSTRITDTTHHADDWVIFAQDEIKLGNALDIVGGFRFDQHSEYGSHFSPKISTMYQLLPFNIRATYGMGFKAPTLKEMYMNWDHGGGGPYVYGNPDLKPETSNYGSFSVEFINNNFNSSVSLFRTDLKNMIDSRITPNDPNTYLYGNVAKAMVQGAELLMKIDVGLGIAVSGGYSFVDTENKETGNVLFGRAKHSGLFKLEYINNTYGFNCNLRGKFVGEKLWDEYEDEDTGDLVQYKQAPYAIWRFNFNTKFFSYFNLTFGVDNIFDYMDKSYLITPGRRYYGGISLALISDNFTHK
jgi:outer membrane receptor for ferrienterochelin and colicins